MKCDVTICPHSSAVRVTADRAGLGSFLCVKCAVIHCILVFSTLSPSVLFQCCAASLFSSPQLSRVSSTVGGVLLLSQEKAVNAAAAASLLSPFWRENKRRVTTLCHSHVSKASQMNIENKLFVFKCMSDNLIK